MPLSKDDISRPVANSWLNDQPPCGCDFIGECTHSSTPFHQSGPLSDHLDKDVCRHVFRSRRVTFDTDVQTWEVPHLNDLSKECVSETWYTQDDFKHQKSHIKSTLLLLACGSKIPKGDDNYCFRGLEAITKAGIQRRRKQQDQAMKAVFRAQAFQRSQGFTDYMYVAELYSGRCRTSQARAYSRAIFDQEEASK